VLQAHNPAVPVGERLFSPAVAQPVDREQEKGDELASLVEAIEATWPACVAHRIRASTQFVSDSERRKVAAAHTQIYTVSSQETARKALSALSESERARCPGR